MHRSLLARGLPTRLCPGGWPGRGCGRCQDRRDPL